MTKLYLFICNSLEQCHSRISCPPRPGDGNLIVFLFRYVTCCILFFCSVGVFAKILSSNYDPSQNYLRFRYSAQSDNFNPNFSDIISESIKQVTNKDQPLFINLRIVIWDCEARADNKYRGFWNALFYRDSKRNFYKTCQQEVEIIRNIVRTIVHGSNRNSDRLTQLKMEQNLNYQALTTHEKDLAYNLKVQESLRKLKKALEALQPHEEITQQIIIKLKKYLETQSNTKSLSVITTFRQQVEKDPKYNTPIIIDFLDKLEHLYNLQDVKSSSVFVNLNTFLQQKNSLPNPVNLSDEDIEKLQNMAIALNKAGPAIDKIIELSLKSAVHIQVSKYPNNTIPHVYKNFLTQWVGREINDPYLPELLKTGYIAEINHGIVKLFFTDPFSYIRADGSHPTFQEEKHIIEQKLSLTWAEIGNRILDRKLPFYLSTYFKEEYQYNNPESVERFMMYEEGAMQILSVLETMLSDTGYPLVLSEIDRFKKNIQNDPVLLELTNDLIHQLDFIVENQKEWLPVIKSTKMILARLREQVSKNSNSSALYSFFQFIKSRTTELLERQQILQNRQQKTLDWATVYKGMIQAQYGNLSSIWKMSTSELQKLPPFQVSFSFEPVGSPVESSGSGGGGFSGGGCFGSRCALIP